MLTVLQFAGLLLAFEKPAHAYVDPGSGLLIFQVLGSMVAGAAYFLRYRIRRIFGFKTDEPQADKGASGSQSSQS